MELSPIPEWIGTAICVIALTGCLISLIVCTITGRWGDDD